MTFQRKTMPAVDAIGKLTVVAERTADDAARLAGEDLSRLLAAAKKKKQAVLLLASGGTALGVFGHISKRSLGKHLTLSVLDERYDPTGRTTNSRALSLMEFSKIAAQVGVGHIEVKQNATLAPADIAKQFEKDLRAWRKKFPNGQIVATVGIGTDGHTAGMMPYPEDPKSFQAQFEDKSWVCAYDSGDKNIFRLRITATATFLRELSFAFVFATGEGKAEALHHLKNDGPIAEVPARILKEVSGILYTDRGLYNKLSRLEANI